MSFKSSIARVALVSLLVGGSALASAPAAEAVVGPAAHAAQGVRPAFDALIRSLEAAQGRRADRASIDGAGRKLEDAIEADGGMRDDLKKATQNIVNSLKDGSFSAEASLRVLRDIAPRTVLDPEPWHPGPLYPEPVGFNMHQKHDGDCVGISALKAFSSTTAGESILRHAVRRDPAGGFTVNLPGAPSQVFHVPDDNLDQYGTNDPAGAAIIGAIYQYFGKDPHHSALPTNLTMELLAGDLGHFTRLSDGKSSSDDIERFLVQNTPAVGADVAIVFIGKPVNATGDWSRGSGHEFAIQRIDAASQTVFYTNPWNDEKVHTIAVSDLAAQASGTTGGAAFETISF